MGGLKQVKVDNWGVFFLQRLKNFFNNIEYCDLTLQFRDCAQLKVHRLVLNACTKYFEFLERTCEIYDDCLIMPEDLQADVVVPIVNFMYTGQLEYEDDMFDRLYKTAQLMKMTVLIKLLDSQKSPYEAGEPKNEAIIMNRQLATKPPGSKTPTGEDYNNFNKKNISASRKYGPGPGHKLENAKANSSDGGPGRPTRYELPEELDSDEIFDTSFADISYESLARKESAKRKSSGDNASPNIYDEATCSRKFEELKKIMYKRPRMTPEPAASKQIKLDRSDEMDFQRKMRSEYINRDSFSDEEGVDPFNSLLNDDKSSYIKCEADNDSIFNTVDKYRPANEKEAIKFDKNSNVSLSHAKIISEVLKKYPHLVKSDKNIKLKIMTKNERSAPQNYILEPNKNLINPASSFAQKLKKNQADNEDKKLDWIYVSRHDNMESVGNLIALGAENTQGPWLCLICGTPNKAMKFLSYRAYYKHLVDVHKQRIAPKICEYCGFKSGKRNHLLHHMYTKHGIQPPAHYHFPKCEQCSYIALTEAFLAKHVLSHVDNRHPCLICNTTFKTRTQLLHHIYLTGHKLFQNKQSSTKCVYCNKVFLRPNNLYAHIKVAHADMIKQYSNDFDDNDYSLNVSKYEYPEEQQEEHVKIKQEYDGKIQIISNTQIHKPFLKSPQKLLNTALADKARDKIRGFESSNKQFQRKETCLNETDKSFGNTSRHIGNDMDLVDVVVLNDNEYILERDEQELEHEHMSEENEEMILPDLPGDNRIAQIMTTSTKILHKPNQTAINVKHTPNQPIQYVLAGNQQYKKIVSNTQIVYDNSGKSDATNSSNYVQDQIEDIQLESAQPDSVMVLNEEDFQIACSETIPNHGSNIVVVYNHPSQNDKEFIEVSNPNEAEFDNSTNSQELEEMQVEECEQSNILSEHGIVHETVETWQEETAEDATHDKEFVVENDDHMVVEENVIIDASTETVVDFSQSNNDIKNTEEEIFHENENDAPLDTTEVEIPLNDSDNQEINNEVIENGNENADYENIETTSDVNVCEEQDNNAESIECIETTNSHDYALQQKDDINIPENFESAECDDKIVTDGDLPENKSSSVELETELDAATTIADDIPVIVSNKMSCESVEVEESIENIREEIKKQVMKQNLEECNPVVDNSEQIKEIEPDANVLIENKSNVEESIADEPILKDNNDLSIESDQAEDEVSEQVACDKVGVVITDCPEESAEVDDRQAKKADTIKSVEKISHLLNEWEDNDSQAEDAMSYTNDNIELNESETKESDTTVEGEILNETVIKELHAVETIESDNVENKELNVVDNKEFKDSNIEKLVSDWDEEEEK